MLAELASAASSLAAVKDLVLALVNERDRHKAAAIELDLTQKIIELQTQFLEVHSTVVDKDALIQTLAERVRELQSKESEKARYRLAKVGIDRDVFAYQLRPAAELVERSDEPPHLVCQSCFDIGKKSVLQADSRSIYCPVCNRKTRLTSIKDHHSTF